MFGFIYYGGDNYLELVWIKNLPESHDAVIAVAVLKLPPTSMIATRMV